MTRNISLIIGDKLIERAMPCADEYVLPGIRWGDPWRLFTPAYWLAQAWMAEADVKPLTKYRARHGIVEELVFCLLGGYGITTELASAAYKKCCKAGLIASKETQQEAWAYTLSMPMKVGREFISYRYPKQKSKYLASAMEFVLQEPLHVDSGIVLRDQLLRIPGVGYKTASWITRNVLDCDEVAILDIHIVRAGKLCGLFNSSDRVEKDYRKMESRFLKFCQRLGLRPAVLDCIIWDQMREAGSLPIHALNHNLAALANRGKSPKSKNLQQCRLDI